MQTLSHPVNLSFFLQDPDSFVSLLSDNAAKSLRIALIETGEPSKFSIPAKGAVTSLFTINGGDISVSYSFPSNILDKVVRLSITQSSPVIIEKLDALLLRRLRGVAGNPKPSNQGIKTTDHCFRIPASSIKDEMIALVDAGFLDGRTVRWNIAKILHEDEPTAYSSTLAPRGCEFRFSEGGCFFDVPPAFFQKNLFDVLAGFQHKTLFSVEGKIGSALYK